MTAPTERGPGSAPPSFRLWRYRRGSDAIAHRRSASAFSNAASRAAYGRFRRSGARFSTPSSFRRPGACVDGARRRSARASLAMRFARLGEGRPNTSLWRFITTWKPEGLDRAPRSRRAMAKRQAPSPTPCGPIARCPCRHVRSTTPCGLERAGPRASAVAQRALRISRAFAAARARPPASVRRPPRS